MDRLTAAADHLASRLDGGGYALSIWDRRGERLHLCRGDDGNGRAWSRETLVPVWSTTKGLAAAAILVLLERSQLTLASPVRRLWPEFMHDVSVGQLLSHQAGLAAPEAEFSVFDHAGIAAHLASQTPNWRPGAAHGYHPRTFGFLLDEISLRLTGKRLGAFWNQEIAGPLDLDFFMGAPETDFPRIARVRSGRARPRPEEKEFAVAYMKSDSLTRRAFDCLSGLNAVFAFNHPEAWQCGSPAFGGVGGAASIAKFYAALVQRQAPFSSRIATAATTPLVRGADEILRTDTCFSAGFQLDPLRTGDHGWIGHPGAGGSVGFAIVDREIGVGFVLNVLEPGLFPHEDIRELICQALQTS